MVVTKTVFIGVNKIVKYISLSGTAAEVLQELADGGVAMEHIVEMKNDATFCVYQKG